MNDEMFKAWRESQGQPVDALPRQKGNAMTGKTDELLRYMLLNAGEQVQSGDEYYTRAEEWDAVEAAWIGQSFDPDWLPVRRRAPAQPAVKALEWKGEAGEYITAQTEIGQYRVLLIDKTGLSSWRGPMDQYENVNGFEVAKAAAQSDYERRILSALVSAPADPATAPSWNGWRSIDTAPEDQHVILATSGGFVGEAIMLRDEDTGAQKWAWALGPVHENHRPYGWKPLPEPLFAPVLSDLRPCGFDGPTGAE